MSSFTSPFEILWKLKNINSSKKSHKNCQVQIPLQPGSHSGSVLVCHYFNPTIPSPSPSPCLRCSICIIQMAGCGWVVPNLMTFYGADPGLISSRSSLPLSWHRSKKEGADYYSLHSRQVSQEMHFYRLVKMQNRRDTTGMMVLTNGWLLVKIESFPRQYSGRRVVITVECWPKCIQWNYLILFRTNHSLGKQSTNQVPQFYCNLGHFLRSIPLIYPPCDRMPSIMGCLFWMGSARKGFHHLGVDPFGQNLSSGSTSCNQNCRANDLIYSLTQTARQSGHNDLTTVWMRYSWVF